MQEDPDRQMRIVNSLLLTLASYRYCIGYSSKLIVNLACISNGALRME